MSENPTNQPLEEQSAEGERQVAAEEVEQLRAEIARLEAEASAQNDLALRAAAELENVRRRMRRDVEQQLKFATHPLVEEVLPVLDNLERALAAAQVGDSAEGLLQGVQMVATQLAAVLGRHGVQPIAALGEPFDPAWHEAVGQQPSAEYPAGHVMQVIRGGYQLHDRVIRAAQVFVSSGPPAGEPGA